MRLIFSFIFMFIAVNATANEGLNVAVASNFISTARALNEKYVEQGGNAASLSNASTGKLYTQILHGAPYDVFMAADVLRPKLLEEKKLIVPQSRKAYAIGTLVFWSKTISDDCHSLLQKRHFKRLSIANPKTAPYGQAANEVLKKEKLWNAVQKNLVTAENIGQAMAYLKAGAADAGFISGSQARVLNKGCQWKIPADYYSKLEQQVVILNRSKKQTEAAKFAIFLQSEEAQKIILQYGYDIELNR